MTSSPDAGSAARNQYGTFQVHYASDAQQKYVRNLVTQRVVPTPPPEAYADLLAAVADNRLNKKAASRLIDWLLTLPHARKTDGTPRITAPTQTEAERWPASDKQLGLIRDMIKQKVWKDPGMAVDTFPRGDNGGIWAALQVEADRPVSKRQASAAIDHLFASPRLERKAADAAELEAGMYRRDGVIYKVYRAVHGSGKMCAKELVVERDCLGHESTNGPIGNVEYCDGTCGSGETHARFDYRGLASRFVRAEDRMTLEQAKEFGAIYGVCCVCGATLTDEGSIAAGIGPVCASRF